MPSFNDFTTTNDYQASAIAGAPTIENVLPLPNGGGRFNVDSSAGAVLCQVQYGGLGAVEWAENEEQLLNPGAYGTIPENACGIRFRSAVPGVAGKVSASIGTDPTRPALRIDALGSVAFLTVTAIIVRVFTASDLNYKPGTGCKAVYVECIGGGGGGGGAAASGVNQGCAGAGGGGGGYAAALLDPTTWTGAVREVGVGAGGPGGAPGGNAGGIGVASNFQDNGGLGLLVQATAGSGGSGGGIVSVPNLGSPAQAGRGGLGTDGQVLLRGDWGNGGVVFSNGGLGGKGGAAARGGGGGAGFFNAGPGNTGEQYGGGGGGGVSTNSGAQGGGNGAQGVVIITEYY